MNVYNSHTQSSLPQPNTMAHGVPSHHQLPSLATSPNYQTQHHQQHLPSMPPPPSTPGPYGGEMSPGYPPGALQNRHQPQPSPTTPGAPPDPTPAEMERTARNLKPLSMVVDGRRYTLDVQQQPQRARMCGFGDKDRRPITPPPAIRLIVTDESTGKEVDVNTIEYAHFVLTVDLWDDTASKEVNLVRSTTTTPSISSTSHESYNNLEKNPYLSGAGAGPLAPYPPPSHHMNAYGQPPPPPVNYGQHQYGQASQYGATPQGYAYAPQHQPPYFSQAPNEYGVVPSSASQRAHVPAYGPPQVYDPTAVMSNRMSFQGNNQPQGMFTRNLIGSLAASAFRLTDHNDNIGIWFVLQDLSVRTEGTFRLRFSFVDIKPRPGQKDQPVAVGKTNVLASCFSDVLQVYSAKKFPGVCESTQLSKIFATQGIKIPIRKEGSKKEDDDLDDD